MVYTNTVFCFAQKMEHNVLSVIKSFEFSLKLLFSLTCFSLVAYMTFFQFQAFVENDDSTVVSYKTFRSEIEDSFPTFTICLTGDHGSILKRHLMHPVCGYPCSNTTYHQENIIKCRGYCNNFKYFETISPRICLFLFRSSNDSFSALISDIIDTQLSFGTIIYASCIGMGCLFLITVTALRCCERQARLRKRELELARVQQREIERRRSTRSQAGSEFTSDSGEPQTPESIDDIAFERSITPSSGSHEIDIIYTL